MDKNIFEEKEELEKCLVDQARAADVMISINLEGYWIEEVEYNIVDHVEKQKLMLST